MQALDKRGEECSYGIHLPDLDEGLSALGFLLPDKK